MSARRPESGESRGNHSPAAAGLTAPSTADPAGSRIPNLNVKRRTSLMHEPVLVLNATYEPINVTAVRRAMVLMLKGVAQAEELHASGSTHGHECASRAVGDPVAGLPALFRNRAGHFRGKISCCATGIRANFAARYFRDLS